MRKPRIAGLLIVFSIIMMAACKHEPPVNPNPNPGGNGNNNGGNNGNNNPPDTSLCFERDILPIFISNCAKSGCHDAVSRQDGYQFTDYNSITAKDFKAGDPEDTELYEKITEDDNDKRMPPPPHPPLSSTDKEKIRRWIAEGAKNTTNCPTLCDSNKFTYSTAIRPMLDQYCKGCHNTSLANGGVMLDTYDGVKTVALNGNLLSVIKHAPGFSPMPKGGSKLSDCQIKQVEKWVANGALNN